VAKLFDLSSPINIYWENKRNSVIERIDNIITRNAVKPSQIVEKTTDDIKNAFVNSDKIVNKINKSKIVILCAGKSDELILKIITERILSDNKIIRECEIITADENILTSRVTENVRSHYTKERVLVVIDGHGYVEATAKELLMRAILRQNQVVIDPEIKVWLLGNDYNYIKERLYDIVNERGGVEKLAREVDIKDLLKRDAAFGKLYRALIE
jgi:hypothetical protein